MENFTKFVTYAGLTAHPYQYDGVQWCLEKEMTNDTIKGGFLADEMGLGKTITMIGLMVANILDRTLIVLPPILINQWRDQILKTTRHDPLVYHGANKKRTSLETLKSARIVLTSYDTISLSTEKKDIHQVEWNRVIFDEAHHLRNKKTARHLGALQLQTGIKWMVTGTPIQNRRKDIVNLCSILGITETDDLRLLSQRYILRRTKKDVGISIPDMHPSSHMVKWTDDAERILSEDLHSRLEMCPRRRNNSLLEGDYNKLALFTKTKQVCAYPKMLNKYLAEEDQIGATSKLDSVVSTILERRENGNGKLIFCNYKDEIDEIKARLVNEGVEKVVVFDGRTTKKQRALCLSSKNNVIILQIQTGCEGLNLQEFYSEVYFVSPHWNPAIEDQAIARCHRIGQTKPVSVHRFQMSKFVEDDSSSMDNYISGVQEAKRELINLL
jgi:SNF2 family DNA or RNA helicase